MKTAINKDIKQSLPTLLILALVLLLAASSRLVPHPANFTPLLAMAIVGGQFLKRGPGAYLIVLGAIFVSDLIIGFHTLVPVVYLSLAAIVLFNKKFKLKKTVTTYAASGVLGSVFFFMTTNFAVWMQGGMYPKTFAGLWTCYVAALPFFQNTLASTLVYSAAIVFAIQGIAKLSGKHLAVTAK